MASYLSQQYAVSGRALPNRNALAVLARAGLLPGLRAAEDTKEYQEKMAALSEKNLQLEEEKLDLQEGALAEQAEDARVANVIGATGTGVSTALLAERMKPGLFSDAYQKGKELLGISSTKPVEGAPLSEAINAPGAAAPAAAAPTAAAPAAAEGTTPSVATTTKGESAGAGTMGLNPAYYAAGLGYVGGKLAKEIPIGKGTTTERAKGAAAGATIGTAILPGAGTVIGGLAGAYEDKIDDAVKDVVKSVTGGGCCFIFLEADRGIDEVVRLYRDEHLTLRNRRGYYKLSEVLVPLMRTSHALRTAVRLTLTRPLIHYGRYHYGKPQGRISRLIARHVSSKVKDFWMWVFDYLGQDHPLVRINGEIV